eukprot:TRINITY_DN652_c0_g3_i1.p1 TRINITY_DN652_c0_g3~~TRINITY_DN652_c0_g3_i1.p1  ORF type:complete len:396 (-),score=69.77 TRINITY_DN652_c0_g3_i1:99-1286(-)
MDETKDSFKYDAAVLLSLQVIGKVKGSVWTQASLWKHMWKLLCIALITAYFVVLCVHEPTHVKTGAFEKIILFLRVIVGFFLGFFLKSSVGRWQTCIVGFMQLFDAIRKLHCQLLAFGVPRARIHLLVRYCILSARSLDIALHSDDMSRAERAAFRRQEWSKLLSCEDDVAWTSKESFGKVLSEEAVALSQVADPANTLWVWITSLITRMSAEGELPPMASAAYGRVMGLADAAYASIRTIRSSMSVRPPYVYLQALAMLVCINNILTACSCGLVLGVALAEGLAMYRLNPFMTTSVPWVELYKDCQALLLTTVMGIVGPLIYQALLEIGICLATPFDRDGEYGQSGAIPISRMVAELEQYLRDAEVMNDCLPGWEQAYFKPPPAPPAATATEGP